MSALHDHLTTPSDGDLWGEGIRTQIRITKALMIRDAVARFGHGSLGFFWIIGEPILLIGGVIVLWWMTRRDEGSPLIGVVPFALTAYAYITLWRHLIARSIRPMTRNAALFYFGRIKFVDVLLAGALLETVAIFAAFLIVYVPLVLLGFAPMMHDPLLSVGGFLLAAWFGFAFGLIIAAISEFSEAAERFIQPLMYLTLPATGIFTMLYWLPGKAQNILSWSPLVSGVEMFRGGIFPLDTPARYDVLYLVSWCIALTAIGLPLCDYAQKRAHFDN